MDQNDHDELNLLDETNQEWVSSWRKGTNKKPDKGNDISIVARPLNNQTMPKKAQIK
jgi:hypothetical protein